MQSSSDASSSSSSTPRLTVHSHRSPNEFFTPTHIRFSELADHSSSPPKVEWQSRRARKGRYAQYPAKGLLPPNAHWPSQTSKADSKGGKGKGKAVGHPGDQWTSHQGATEDALTRTETVEGVLYGDLLGRVKRTEAQLKPGLRMDISFWEAMAFTFGSMVWVVNGFTVWFPILRPELDTKAFTYTAAALAFIGGTVFEVGSYLMVIEALDRGREINFGTALGQLLDYRRHVPSGHDPEILDDAMKYIHEHEHEHNRTHNNDSHDDGNRASSTSTPQSESPKGNGGSSSQKRWIWWGRPMWHDMGYMAGLIQLMAASVFWVATVTGLPGVIPGFIDGGGSQAIIDVFYWTPQVVGGTGFIISSLILMIEVQTKWYAIKPLDIGWQVGFWNLIGALGFTLCGALGYSSSSGAKYQSALATFWGSWAFLIGSGCQIWEIIWREPPPKEGQEDSKA